ncbi:hypothetical protein [Alistipes sp. ZOR0009]|uniref:hypothetical protein n=1 Tax=Alistipes sp. ZOR0009 TaxID=1339253 RepID=UPI0006490673|nr:hypothetical protein [Alistipes sp. ZOR0009]
MNKSILLALLVSINFYCNAQSIKAAAEQQKRKQQYKKELRDNEIRQAVHRQKAQLNLNNLLQLLQCKDLDYVDRFLSEKGWKLHSTNINETNDSDEEVSKDYKTVTWALDKDDYSGLAKGWFYFYLYSTYDNAITYAIADEIQLNKLKSELTSNGYRKIQATDAVSRGLESIYRNNLYEVNFKKELKESSESGADIHYSFYIYNYKQVEERKVEAELIAREAEEKEKKYQNAIQRAESAYYQKQYSIAKQAYNEAITIKPENEEILSSKIAEVDISIFYQNANDFFKSKQFQKAKEEYGKALLINQNTKIDEIKCKIKEIDDFLVFLKERTYRKYNYQDIERANYAIYNQRIVDELKMFLLNEQNIPKSDVTIICEIDTLGVNTTRFVSSSQDVNLIKKLDELSKNLKLNPVSINGYSANAKAEFIYGIEANHATITVKKRLDIISSTNRDFKLYSLNINKELSKAPIGNYTFNLNKAIVNSQEYNNNQLVKVNGKGGPSNALLSVLVPGLGVRNVTGGAKSGLSRTLWTYGLIGAGIGCKLFSNKEYNAYHSATTQTEMDNHYNLANGFNNAFYTCISAGLVIWIYDIVWVANKGAANKKAQKAWKRNHLGVYYNQEMNASGLSYTINF